MSVELSYIRRTWGNMQATVNRAFTPADFDPFVYNVPQDPKLPNGGGYALTFYDVKPAKFGQFDNYRTFADDLGGVSQQIQRRRFHGERPPAGCDRAGGFSTGNRVEDDCGVVARIRRSTFSPFWGGSSAVLCRLAVCRRPPTVAAGFLPSRVGLADEREGAGVVPRAEDRRAGQRNVPQPAVCRERLPVSGPQSLTGQAVALQIPGFSRRRTSRGRSGADNVHDPEHRPARRDVRRSPELRRSPVGQDPEVRRHEAQVSLDIFNLTNSNTTEKYQLNYGPTYLNPLQITAARLFKISAQFDF